MPDQQRTRPYQALVSRLARSRRLLTVASIVAAVAAVIGFVALSGWIRFLCGLAVGIWILLQGLRAVSPTATVPAANDLDRRRLDVIDGVVAELGRRPWDPTLIPSAGRRLDGAVLLLPGAAYHLPEMVALAGELERRGRRAILGSGTAHFDRNRQGLSWYPDREVLLVDDQFEIDGLAAVVAMKDWEGYGAVVDRAKAIGVPTLAKVEGAQDFEDLETPGSPRRPYRNAGLVLCQGENDFNALPGTAREIVGSTRLERLRWAPATGGVDTLVVVNYNFSYGVLADQARAWLGSVTDALRAAGVPYVICAHPSVRLSTKMHPATTIPISLMLTRATALVSRFSTVPFEAMARGVPFIYHNPHGERIPTFLEPEGAFDLTTNSTSLGQVIRGLAPPGEAVRTRTDAFFRRQVSIIDERPSEVRAADVIENVTR